jgi:hypothetical protein
MKKKHEILIQKKVDGLLSAVEEKQFYQLIAQSDEAANFYNAIKKVDNLLTSDAEKTETFSSTQSIMNTISKSNIQLDKTKTRLFTPQLMKYAAILVIGVLLGTVFSYTFFNSTEIDKNMLSGTIVHKNQEQLLFSDHQTSINVQPINTGELKMALISIETEVPIKCEIISSNSELTKITPLTNSKNLSNKTKTTSKLTYTITGATVFQVIVNKDVESELKFTRESKIIARKIIE